MELYYSRAIHFSEGDPDKIKVIEDIGKRLGEQIRNG